MGTSVYGNKPANDAGKQFSRNHWGWKPIVDYFEENHETLAKHLKDKITPSAALKMSDALSEDLASGFAQRYTDGFMKHQENLEDFDCSYCLGTGIRKDEVGIHNGMDRMWLRKSDAERLGRDKGYCNGCRGTGRVKDNESAFFLFTEDLEEFATFLRNCGGAKIL